MTDKATFLARLRAQAASSVDSSAETVAGPTPVRYASDRTGVAGFSEAWTALGGTLDVIAPSQLSETVVNRLRPTDRSLIGPDPLFDEILHDGMRWPECGKAGTDEATIGVVRACAAVAETGSVFLSAADNGGRAPSLLPPSCIFVLDADQIVDTPGDVLRNHRDRWPDGPPSQLVLVTGPSRSADIELQLVVGVHGPGSVHAIILTEE